MAELARYRDIIEACLTRFAGIRYSHGDLECEAVFDRPHDRYLLVTVGWDRRARVHGVLVHLDIIDGKIWIQRDGLEQGIANELIEAGIPRDRLVLGFNPPEIRQLMEAAGVA